MVHFLILKVQVLYFLVTKVILKNIEYGHVLYFIPFYMIENVIAIFFFNVDVLVYVERS